MPPLSTTRKILRVVAIALWILTVPLIVFSFTAEPASYLISGGAPEFNISFESNFLRIGGIFFGFLAIFVGYRIFRYIPKSEREKELIDDTY